MTRVRISLALVRLTLLVAMLVPAARAQVGADLAAPAFQTPDTALQSSPSTPAPSAGVVPDTSIVSSESSTEVPVKPNSDESPARAPDVDVLVPSDTPPLTTTAHPELDTVTPRPAPPGTEFRLTADPRTSEHYRSPRRAMFASLLVPGLGQAWVGSYWRAAVFAAIEVALGWNWYRVAVRGARRKEAEVRRFAAEHWSQGRYEAEHRRIFGILTDSADIGIYSAVVPERSTYCLSLHAQGTQLADGCLEPPTATNANFDQHLVLFGRDTAWFARGQTDSVSSFRSRSLRNGSTFHELLGRHDEFVLGWTDATAFGVVTWQQLRDDLQREPDTGAVVRPSPWGTSAHRETYRSLRREVNNLARSQRWFFGGMLLNHVLSAVDAAMVAERHNNELFQLQTAWWQRLRLYGGPLVTSNDAGIHASLTWGFR